MQESVNVFVSDEKGKLLTYHMPSSITILDLKKQLQRDHEVAANLPVIRIGLFLGSFSGKELFDHSKILASYNVTSEGIKVSFKDLGVVLPQNVAYNIYYAGPTVMILLFYFQSRFFYGQEQDWKLSQQVGALICFLHFFRRVLESNFVHNFSEAPERISQAAGITFFYWFVFSYCVMYLFL
jgi:hypothetical protein